MFKTREEYLKSDLAKKDFFGNKDLTLVKDEVYNYDENQFYMYLKLA